MSYPWGHKRRYNDYPSYCKDSFNKRVQKVSINAGLSCPNRDGTKSTEGCTYCYNRSFRPEYCESEKTITKQINQGIDFFTKKYPSMDYFAYFQNYTNTYSSIDKLIELYTEATSHPLITGLIIGTRPDCINDNILSYLKELSKDYYIAIEFGVESTKDSTLELINRCHTYEESITAIKKTTEKGIKAGAHLIAGLPGESREDILSHAHNLSLLPLHTLKLHQLQIIKGTKMESLYYQKPELFINFGVDDYIETMVDFLEILNPSIIIERFVSESPRDLLISPCWGLKNFEIINKIDKKLLERETWQGRLYN